MIFNHICKPLFSIFVLAILLIPAYGAQNTISDPNIQLNLTYPDVVTQGKEFVLSSVLQATVDQVSNITVTITCPELQIQQNSFHLDKLAKGSTFGNDFNSTVKNGVPDGNFVANAEIDYFVKGFFDAEPIKHIVTQTVQFVAASKPSISLSLQAPSDVFSGEPFSIQGIITNQGSAAHNIELGAFSPDLQLAGQKSLSVTNLDAGKSMNFNFLVQTQKDLGAPVNAVVHVNGTYSDDSGKTYSIDNSFNVYASQRGLLEIGDANGIWVGQFFIAPVVGVGTIVSSVIGFLIFLWHYKNKKKKRKVKKSN